MTVSPELFFAISHELRHSYQIANGADLKGYQASDKISVEQYNLQSLEVDAKRIRVNANKPMPEKSVLALFLQNINLCPVRNMLQQLRWVRDLNI